MNFKQAIQALQSGKKIHRRCWEAGHYWTLVNGILVNSIGELPRICSYHFENQDWEVYEEKKGKIFKSDFSDIEVEVYDSGYICIREVLETYTTAYQNSITLGKPDNARTKLIEEAIKYVKENWK